MTAADIGFWVATVAAVIGGFSSSIAAAYTILAYHSPPTPQTKSSKAQAKSPNQPVGGFKRQAIFLFLLGAVSWSGALFAYYTRSPTLNEYSISPENADIDIRLWQKRPPDKELPNYSMNAFTINRGKSSAIGMMHNGIVAVGAGIDAAIIDALFLSLKGQFKLAPPSPAASVIRPGQDSTWFSIFGPPESEVLSKALVDGTQYLFALNVMRYRDDHLAPGKYIYTEHCVYYIKDTLHLCESGHNRSYVSE